MSQKLIEQIFSKMLGQICWDIHCHRINLSIKLGEPRLHFESCKRDPVKDRQLRKYTWVRAEWFFWVYNAYWRLEALNVAGDQKLVATGSSPKRHKQAVCSLLNGQKLVRVEIDGASGRTIVAFDLGAELTVRRPTRETKKLWILYEPNGYCLSLNGDGTYDHCPECGDDKRPSVESKSLAGPITVGKANG